MRRIAPLAYRSLRKPEWLSFWGKRVGDLHGGVLCQQVVVSWHLLNRNVELITAAGQSHLRCMRVCNKISAKGSSLSVVDTGPYTVRA